MLPEACIDEILAARLLRAAIEECADSDEPLAILSERLTTKLTQAFASNAERYFLSLLKREAESAKPTEPTLLESIQEEITRRPSQFSVASHPSRNLGASQIVFPAHCSLLDAVCQNPDGNRRALDESFFATLLDTQQGLLKSTKTLVIANDFKQRASSKLDTDLQQVKALLQPALSSDWWRNDVGRLAASIDALLKKPNPQGLQRVTKLVEEARDNEKLRVPVGNEDWLYILAFLPENVRFALQPLLFHHERSKHLDTLCGENSCPTKMALCNALKLCSAATVFSDRHYHSLLALCEPSPETTLFVIEEVVKRRAALSSLEEMITSEGSTTISASTGDVAQSIAGELGRKAKAIRAQTELQFEDAPTYCFGTDPGHFFSELTDITAMCTVYFGYTLARKAAGAGESPRTERVAVTIVEDDPSQMNLYRTYVAQHTPFEVNSACSQFCATPSEFLGSFNSAERLAKTGLVLLDIESEGAPFGGLQLAEQLLRDSASRYNDKEEGLLIVVWSASPEKVQQACDVLTRLTNQLQSPFIRMGSDTGDKAAIRLLVRQKGDDEVFRRMKG